MIMNWTESFMKIYSERLMSQLRKGRILILLLVFILPACASGKSASSQQCLPIRIGVVLADESQENGREQKQGYEMALAEINQAGGVQGCPVELIYKNEGEQSDAETAQVAVLQLADENVLAILGGTTNDATLRAAAIANYFKVPLLIPINTSDEITQRGNQWVFRLSASNASEANTAFEMVRSELGVGATVVILYENTSYGESTAVVAAEAAMAQELDVNGYFSFSSQSSDFSALANQVDELGPEVIYIISDEQEQASALFRSLEEQRVSANLVIGHGSGFTERSFLYDAAGSINNNLDQLILVTNWAEDLTWHGIDKFVYDFKSFSQETGQNDFQPVVRNVEAYSALHLMANALDQLQLMVPKGKQVEGLEGDQLKSYREQLALALRGLNADQGETLFGPTTFDSSGQNKQTTILVQILEERLVTVYPSQYAEQGPVYDLGW